ncbi:MAG: hypothetical protein DMF64_19245 [Acidobacteria bacterium]|nr:MAG: hypothetical protein DMF64_19245 [Acidobacteriota bacterium]
MKEVHAVVGYLSDKVAKALGPKGQSGEPLEIKLERGGDGDTYVRISPNDIAGVLVGASQKGETSVQVLLKENATVETFTRAAVSDLLKPIRDLSFIKYRPPINVIYVDPRFIDKLIDINRQKTS